MEVEKLYDFDSRLEGKIAIITDGASGIEASAVSLFHEHSVWVVVADVQEELGRALAAKLGHQASNGHCNVSAEAEVRDLMDATVAKHGQLDITYTTMRGSSTGPSGASSTHPLPISIASSASTSTGPPTGRSTQCGTWCRGTKAASY
ncbi:hypothetical protein ACJRO7_032984 [Eucalyptus globulus]|uniref:Uncharacterized protein n=1 Tax=Eucalyptus globulus TaxID=34317 RepID=A0ABD3JQ36_EUCGL